MNIRASGEDYLEAVLLLKKSKGSVRSVDLAQHMGFSKPSISHAVKLLRNGGFLTVDDSGQILLTEVGQEVAERIYERHRVLTSVLVQMGVDPEIAEEDACKMEHVISDTSFAAIKKHAGF